VSSKRLLFLEDLVAKGKADSFARYALALEYKGADRIDDALRAFEALRAADPAYVPQYLMCGTMLIDAGRGEDAKRWLDEGLLVARKAGDTKAAGEIGDALARL
jgi:predicted Zn-dependent protease